MLLSVKELSVYVNGQSIVDHVSLHLDTQEMLAIVGASGSGKTTIGLAVMDILPNNVVREVKFIHFNGQEQYRRGKDVSMVFQEPLYAFNPVYTIGFQINEVLMLHTSLTKQQRYQRILEILDLVGIDDPKRVVKSYPHQLSGGMRQRAMIAQAVVAEPKLIIADEPTSNLDVTLQARVMMLFEKLIKELDLSIMLITHDLGVVEHFADRMMVLKEGKVVESGLVDDIFQQPQDSYTQSLVHLTRC